MEANTQDILKHQPCDNAEKSSPALRRQKMKHTKRDAIDASPTSTDITSQSDDQDCALSYDAEGDEIPQDVVGQVVFRRHQGKSKLFCRSCSSIFIDDVPEEFLETNGIKEDDEDEIDGCGYARVYKNIQRCRCHESVIEKLENYQFGRIALQPTNVMEQFQRSQRPQLKNSTDMTDSDQKITINLKSEQQIDASETEVFISDCSSPESEVSIDLHVISLRCEKGFLRHFVGKQPTAGKPSAEMGLSKGDEMLLLNDKALVDLSAEEMKALFFALEVGKEFTMWTRRKVEKRESGYEYWQITTVIKLEKEDDKIVAGVAETSRAAPGAGDILLPIVSHRSDDVYIHCQQSYIQNDNGEIMIHDLKEDDQRFQFEILQYFGYIFDVLSKETKTSLCLLRYSRDKATGHPPYYFYVDDNQVKLKQGPMDPPTNQDITDGQHFENFLVHNAVFLKYPVNEDSTTGDQWNSQVYLESYKKRGFYLNMTAPSITLRSLEEGELPFTNSAKFDISNVENDIA